ncbi:MAG: molybdenum cofactor biosynthesis protein 1 [Olpidium bornovanus]|uniref:GTP 3',8-cyclase n=1 Tax=Olpidium bornovanus TaxID=278681 RepID=A0A8H7ZRF2_9FUNG|nr:MAG: molybdenum cofactor biosynthesis protein 1 [Olpidium bornovanus]
MKWFASAARGAAAASSSGPLRPAAPPSTRRTARAAATRHTSSAPTATATTTTTIPSARTSLDAGGAAAVLWLKERARARIAAVDAERAWPGVGARPPRGSAAAKEEEEEEEEEEAAAAALRDGAAPALVDAFDRRHTYLRISVTEKCNLRCTYCMPEDGVRLSEPASLMTAEEILRIARLFVSAGVDKVRLTGGEPTVRKDIVDLVAELAKLRPAGLKTIAMTTNGVALKRMLPKLVEGGLNLVNISLDTLDPLKFQLITRRKGHDKVLECVDEAVAAGVRTKINSVVVGGVNDGEVVDFVEFTRHRPVDVRFIEYMPFDGNKWNPGKVVPYEELVRRISREYGPLARDVDETGDTSKAYRVPGFAGRLGFITSMTDHFCAGCNRLRITADGNLKVCLFGNAEVSIRDAMRGGASDAELLEIVGAAVKRKKARHAGMFELWRAPNRPMILIGG